MGRGVGSASCNKGRRVVLLGRRTRKETKKHEMAASGSLGCRREPAIQIIVESVQTFIDSSVPKGMIIAKAAFLWITGPESSAPSACISQCTVA